MSHGGDFIQITRSAQGGDGGEGGGPFQGLLRYTLTWLFVIATTEAGSGLRDWGRHGWNSLGTGADHSRCRWVNQGNIHSLTAVLGANDLCHALRSGLTQQLPCRRREKNALMRFAFTMGPDDKEIQSWG